MPGRISTARLLVQGLIMIDSNAVHLCNYTTLQPRPGVSGRLVMNAHDDRLTPMSSEAMRPSLRPKANSFTGLLCVQRFMICTTARCQTAMTVLGFFLVLLCTEKHLCESLLVVRVFFQRGLICVGHLERQGGMIACKCTGVKHRREPNKPGVLVLSDVVLTQLVRRVNVDACVLLMSDLRCTAFL